jgi:drug/metabolite transporter (DMT)-like permease
MGLGRYAKAVKPAPPPSLPSRKLSLGILAGGSTGIFWGLPFLIPQILKDVGSLEIAFGRFFFFGVISLFFLKKVWRIFTALSARERGMVFLLSATGFWFYSIVLFWSVHETDGVIGSLVLGLLPISIPLFTPDRQSSGLKFFGGLFFILSGLLNLFLYPVLRGLENIKTPSFWGVAGLFSCLAMWTGFAIFNSRFLQKRPQIDRRDFASVMGVTSLVSILPIFLWRVDSLALWHRPDFGTYFLASAALGIGASWLANWLWNICSFHCPSEIAGPLIVSETVFGLIYSFGFEHRWPHAYEVVSIALFLLGVFFAVTAQMREPFRN